MRKINKNRIINKQQFLQQILQDKQQQQLKCKSNNKQIILQKKRRSNRLASKILLQPLIQTVHYVEEQTYNLNDNTRLIFQIYQYFIQHSSYPLLYNCQSKSNIPSLRNLSTKIKKESYNSIQQLQGDIKKIFQISYKRKDISKNINRIKAMQSDLFDFIVRINNINGQGQFLKIVQNKQIKKEQKYVGQMNMKDKVKLVQDAAREQTFLMNKIHKQQQLQSSFSLDDDSNNEQQNIQKLHNIPLIPKYHISQLNREIIKTQPQNIESNYNQIQKKRQSSSTENINNPPYPYYQYPHSNNFTTMTLTQKYNLGYNISKLKSSDLQQICLTFGHQNNERRRKNKKILLFTINLQKLTNYQLNNLSNIVTSSLYIDKNVGDNVIKLKKQSKPFIIQNDD